MAGTSMPTKLGAQHTEEDILKELAITAHQEHPLSQLSTAKHGEFLPTAS